MLKSAVRKALKLGFLVANILVCMALLHVSSHAQAYEDVPPAVPVDAVEAESLPLPEPIYAKAKKAQKQSTQDKKEAQVPEEKSRPNALERFWKKIVKASKGKTEKKQNEEVTSEEKISQDEPKALVFYSSSPTKTGTALATPYLKKTLMPAKPEGGGYYIVELFTTQACPFCPKADAMMKTYSSLSHVIALSCHVDYFDVKEGSLSLPACSSRQNRYESFFKGTPKYTPQMVVNGRYDAVGYLSDKIAAAFKRAHEYPVMPLMVMPDPFIEGKPPTYHVDLPEKAAGRYQLWLIAYDKPRALTIKSGANAGKRMAYYNTVTTAQFFGSWDGQSKTISINTELSERTKGFTFLVQDADTGAILMASKNE